MTSSLFLLLFATGSVSGSFESFLAPAYSLDSSWPIDKSLFVQTAQDFATAVDDRTRHVFVGLRGPGLASTGPVLVFDEHGAFLRSWGRETIGMIHGMRIVRLANGTARLWIADLGNSNGGHTLKLFSIDGELLETIGTPGKAGTGTKPIQFDQIADVAVDKDGNLYIVDGDGGLNNRLVKLSVARTLVWMVGGAKRGNGTGEFYIPHSVEIDPKIDVVWVADRGNNRTQGFDLETGAFVVEWTCMRPFSPCHVRLDSTGNHYLVLDLNYAVLLTMPAPASREQISTCTIANRTPLGRNDSKPHAFSIDRTSGAIYVGKVGANVTEKYVPWSVEPAFVGPRGGDNGPSLLPCTSLSFVIVVLLVAVVVRWHVNSRRRTRASKKRFDRLISIPEV